MRNASKTPVVLVALFAALALAACGSGDEGTVATATKRTPAAPKDTSEDAAKSNEPTIVIRGGEPVGGVEELEYSAGDQIRFQVESDVADEVHIHGYDLMEDVSAGGTVAFDFAAEIEGIFEVELEGLKEQIAELRVNP
jgi:hypothetical protein